MNKQGYANGGSAGDLRLFPKVPAPNPQWSGSPDEGPWGVGISGDGSTPPEFIGKQQPTLAQVIPGYRGDDSDSPAYYAGTYGGQKVIASKTVDPATGEPVTNFTGLRKNPGQGQGQGQVDPALQSIHRQLNFGGREDMEKGQAALERYKANQLANQGAAQAANDAKAKTSKTQIENVQSMLNAAFVEKNEKGEYIPSGDDISEFLRTGITSEQYRLAADEPGYLPRLVQDFVDKSLINKRLNRARSEGDQSNISRFVPRGNFRDIEIGDSYGDTDVGFWGDYLPSKLTPGTDQVFQTSSGLTVPADRALRDAYKRLFPKQ